MSIPTSPMYCKLCGHYWHDGVCQDMCEVWHPTEGLESINGPCGCPKAK